MAHAIEHAKSASRQWGGKWEDYITIENWFDETKFWIGDSSHRMFRHHSEGIQEAIKIFGEVIINSDGKEVYVKYIAEKHIKEDCDNYTPSAKEWLLALKNSERPIWMRKTLKIEKSGNIGETKEEKRS